MMTGYPVIYWMVVAIIAGVVSAVLVGLGYLLGLTRAAQRVATVRDEMEAARLNRWMMGGRYDTRGADAGAPRGAR